MTNSGLLIVISGPSGVGKDTVVENFVASNENCVLSISATTRSPRATEQEGVNYYYLTTEKFEQLIVHNQMLEYAQYGGNYYGTPKKQVEESLAAGKNVILVIEVQGAMQVKKLCPNAVFVFIMPPDSESLRQRLKGRGTESDEELEKRLTAAKTEIAMACEYEYLITNDRVEDCSKKLQAIVTACGFKTKNQKHMFERGL